MLCRWRQHVIDAICMCRSFHYSTRHTLHLPNADLLTPLAHLPDQPTTKNNKRKDLLANKQSIKQTNKHAESWPQSSAQRSTQPSDQLIFCRPWTSNTLSSSALCMKFRPGSVTATLGVPAIGARPLTLWLGGREGSPTKID